MSNRRRAAAIVALVAGAALAVAGCGSGEGGKKSDDKSGAQTGAPQGGGGTNQNTSSPADEPTEILAQIKGEDDMSVTITEAVRDPGGFVTVKGTATNNGDSTFRAIRWRGDEVALAKSGSSVAGAVLVDPAGKKRYYVLRDTDGRCLCTMGLTGIKPGETVPVFAQFPAPPESTTEVEFQLPTMPPAKIQISEG